MKRLSSTVPAFALGIIALCLSGCGMGTVPDGTPYREIYHFSSERSENPPKMLLFTTISPQWFMHKAEYLAGMGVKGAMMNGIMHSWESDVWTLPNHYVPEAPAGRIVGEENPLFQLCRQMNQVCAEHGITENSIKVAYYTRLPDWFDDAAWAQVAENFRQGAIFARDAGFRGVTLDIEYVNEMYHLDWEGYGTPEHPRRPDEEMLATAERRGYQIMSAMLEEFPSMVNWHLPESTYAYGPLAKAHVVGMIRALAERDAPGGLHISTEWTYTVTSPKGLLSYYASVISSTRELLDDSLNAYWTRRCSINPGLWPLGYYRDVTDEQGNRLGYTGKEHTFHGAIVGSYADKSSNYSVQDFRDQFGTVATLECPYFWIYCHGQVLWRMTAEEIVQFRGTTSDTLPVDPRLDEYVDVMRQARPISNPAVIEAARLAREGQRPAYTGVPPAWRLTGVYPSNTPEVYATAYEPETAPESASISWTTAQPESDGIMNLRRNVDERSRFLAYGTAEFELAEHSETLFRFGCNDWGSIFIDGRKVFEFVEPGGRVGEPDQNSFVMNLAAGRHTILIKCGDLGGSAWWYSFRITGIGDDPVPGLRWITQ